MAALYPVQDAFVRGEISPRLHARASLDLYRAALSKCENFITLPHGGIRKRGGTYFVAETKFPLQKCRLIPFVFSDAQAYVLEVGHLYLRVYAYGARVGTVEVVTPWSEADLPEIQFTQSADVMWLVHPDYPPQILTRNDHTDWSIAPMEFTDGPFEGVNGDEALRMYVSAITGTITITADFDAFSAEDVGRLIRIDMESYESIPPWESQRQMTGGAGGELTDGDRIRNSGNVYAYAEEAVPPSEDRFTGATPPTHKKGVEYDGPNRIDQTIKPDSSIWLGIPWEYLHSGFGIARITGFTDAENVTAEVVSRFPEEIVGSGNTTFLWRFSSFEDAYPSSVALFEERLMLSQRFSVFGSKTGDFTKFALGEKDDDGLSFLQAGAGAANDIVWIADADGVLALATGAGLRSLSGSGIDEALTPSSFKNKKSRTAGAARIRPIDAGASFLYVGKSKRFIYEMVMNANGRFVSEDVGQISEHIPKKGVLSLAYQSDPDPLLWFPLKNGELGGFTHQPSQEVRGMHRHRLGGQFVGSTTLPYGVPEDAVVTPGQDDGDDVWTVVKRTIGGVTKRFIEILTDPFEARNLRDAFQVDAGLTYSGETAVSTVSGLDHLIGETVDALAGGHVYRGLTVSETGTVTVPVASTLIHVGLPWEAGADTLELDVGARDGSMMGRRKKVGKVLLSLMETDTSGLEISSFIGNRWEPVRIPSVVADTGAANLFTGNVSVPIDDSWEGQGRVRIRHRNPTPCTIRAMTPVFEGEP